MFWNRKASPPPFNPKQDPIVHRRPPPGKLEDAMTQIALGKHAKEAREIAMEKIALAARRADRAGDLQRLRRCKELEEKLLLRLGWLQTEIDKIITKMEQR